MANEASLVAFCEIPGEEGIEDCVFIEGDLPHLRDAGVTRRLLRAAQETSEAGRNGWAVRRSQPTRKPAADGQRLLCKFFLSNRLCKFWDPTQNFPGTRPWCIERVTFVFIRQHDV